jgi:hypothetical protein
MIQVKADDGVVSVICDKQKEAEPFPRLALRLQLVGESCVLSTITGAENRAGELGKNDSAALEALSKGFLAEGASTSAWMEASELKTATFYRARTSLVNKGYVNHDGKKYTVSDLGRAALTINSHGTIKLLSDSGAALLSNYHNPVGVIVDDIKRGTWSLTVLPDGRTSDECPLYFGGTAEERGNPARLRHQPPGTPRPGWTDRPAPRGHPSQQARTNRAA